MTSSVSGYPLAEQVVEVSILLVLGGRRRFAPDVTPGAHRLRRGHRADLGFGVRRGRSGP